MKWDDYKKLSMEDQKEYDYKFGNKFGMGSSASHVMIFMMLMLMNLCLIVAIIYNPKLANMQDNLSLLLRQSVQLGFFGMISALIIALFDLTKTIYYGIKRRQWVNTRVKEKQE